MSAGWRHLQHLLLRPVSARGSKGYPARRTGPFASARFIRASMPRGVAGDAIEKLFGDVPFIDPDSFVIADAEGSDSGVRLTCRDVDADFVRRFWGPPQV